MILQTKIEFPPLQKRFTYQDSLLFIGSCFANEIGNIMKDLSFDIDVNPLGVLYNPASIASSLDRISSGTPFTKDDLIESQGVIHSFYHHSSFGRESADLFLDNANRKLAEDYSHFRKCKFVVISLGTAWVFRHIKRDFIVSNCHKIHPNEFIRERLSVSEVVNLLSPLIERYPDKEWIFTVSPIRHIKDTLHGNNLSKSILLLAVDILEQKYENVHYFPAYEIVMDELRDYRFYSEDMVHPSAQSVNYIWEHFVKYAIQESEYEEIKRVEKANKSSRHRSIAGQN